MASLDMDSKEKETLGSVTHSFACFDSTKSCTPVMLNEPMWRDVASGRLAESAYDRVQRMSEEWWKALHH